MIEFEGVVPPLAEALNKRGYTALTPVQQAVLAPELEEADTLVSAQTGSGKTVAFGLAIAPDLLGDDDKLPRASVPLALAVAPTRELALQVKRELEWLYEMIGASVASCVGGMDMRSERRALQHGAHIVVGTPGRLRDHIERGSFDTKGLKAVVLDEADEMLDLGFREDLEYILDAAPKERRTLMFSATVPKSIATLAKRYQNNAIRVTTSAEQKQHLDIDYRAMMVAPNDRENAIVNVLRYFNPKNALIFCSTRATVNHMTARFNNRGFSVVALSGELSQNERSHALQSMRDGRSQVCVATDVAARGIDLPNLELVIHADIPTNKATLLHRSGRTGRAGRKGVCALIVTHNKRRNTERLLKSAKIDAIWAKPPSAEEVKTKDHERLLDAPSLNDPLDDTEKAFVEEILARHSPEQIAAAFMRQHFADQAAPEELLDTGPPPEREYKQRENFRSDFEDGVWFSLSIGREQNAEPRWLLPMLCRAGHITKANIGAIRIQREETFVELAADSVEQFLEAIGPDAKIEKSIVVKQLDGKPEITQDGGGRKPFGKKSFSSKKPGIRDRAKSKGKFSSRPDRKRSGKQDDRPTGKKPNRKKPDGKNSENRKNTGKKNEGKSHERKKNVAKKATRSPSDAPVPKKKTEQTTNIKPTLDSGKPDIAGFATRKRKKPPQPE